MLVQIPFFFVMFRLFSTQPLVGRRMRTWFGAPLGSVLGAAVIPLAAGVYLLTTTAWATAERAYLRRGAGS